MQSGKYRGRLQNGLLCSSPNANARAFDCLDDASSQFDRAAEVDDPPLLPGYLERHSDSQPCSHSLYASYHRKLRLANMWTERRDPSTMLFCTDDTYHVYGNTLCDSRQRQAKKEICLRQTASHAPGIPGGVMERRQRLLALEIYRETELSENRKQGSNCWRSGNGRRRQV